VAAGDCKHVARTLQNTVLLGKIQAGPASCCYLVGLLLLLSTHQVWQQLRQIPLQHYVANPKKSQQQSIALQQGNSRSSA
jgi:hypothetical protein